MCGRNTINPIIKAEKTKSKTAPAAISFAIFISGSRCGDTLSHNFSIAVLKPSAINTPPMHMITAHHSHAHKSKRQPAVITHTAAPR